MIWQRKIHLNKEQKDIVNILGGFGNPFWLYEGLDEGRKNLFEGLIKSYPPEAVASYLSEYFVDKTVRTEIRVSNGVEFIIATMPNYGKYEKEATRIMDNLCGYKMTRKGVSDDSNEIKLIFEPKFQKPVNDEMEEHEMLIHVSPSYNKKKILKNGFCPKFKNDIFNFNDRIYFYSTRTQPQTIARLSMVLVHSKNNEMNDYLFDFYMVDPKKIDRNVEFHRDGMTSTGIAYWTYDNVPSNCIVDIERFKYDPVMKKWEIS